MRISEEELERILSNPSVRIHGSKSEQEQKQSRPRRTGKKKDEFQSLAEQRYYEIYIRPFELAEQLDHWSMHESFVVVDSVTYQGINFRKKIYTPDFMLYFKDGKTKAVEVKDDKIRKLQREYPLKKQLFIMKYCIPNGWDFEEIRASDLTSI